MRPMILSALILVGLQQPGGFVAGRYELAERMRRVEVAWMATADTNRRRAATDHISKATTSFFTGRGSEACEALDEALAKLEGRRVRSTDAMNIRTDKPFCEPGATVPLRITWAYRTSSVIPVRVAVGTGGIDVRPGSGGSLNVNPWVVNPELRQNREVGYLMPIRVGNDQRYVYLSFVRRIGDRLEKLKGSNTPFVSDMAKLLDGYQQGPGTLETELPLVQYLFTAEAVEEGKTRVGELDQVYFAKQGSTSLRAAFPKKKSDGPMDVVIALHGAGGSENMFFELYGRGLAVSEALKRGWAFVAPRAGPTAVDDTLIWLRQTRGQALGKVFLLGHSMGGGTALAGSYNVKPGAIATFAPAAAAIGDSLSGVPIYVAVGRADMLHASVAALAAANQGRAGFVFEELDPCEHLMVVADALPAAFKFFDRNVD